MKNFKTKASRLARIFNKGREQWKMKASLRNKIIRGLKIKIRDLLESRDRWKAKSKELEAKLCQATKELEKQKKEEASKKKNDLIPSENISPASANGILLSPAGHHYNLLIISLSICLVTYALNSYRGSQKVFELFSQYFGIETPSFYSIRKWVYRFGLHVLEMKIEYRKDWIFIFDQTIELGQVKCLVVLGIPMAKLMETGYNVKHQDMQVLAMEIMTHSTGVLVCEKLEAVCERVGEPVQVLSDHGPDLKKGTELFLGAHPEVIYTYDVTHKMACLVKAFLKNDEGWSAFEKLCTQSSNQVQQTELYFLVGPNKRIKSRDMNIAKLVEWSQKILYYHHDNDFSKISSTFILTQEDFKTLEVELGKEAVSALSALISKEYIGEQIFREEVIQCVGNHIFEQIGSTVLETANIGKKRFMDKLGWVIEYEDDIKMYSQIVELTTTVEKQIKHEGLSQKSKQVFDESTKDLVYKNSRVSEFKERVDGYLLEEGKRIPTGQSLLGTTDTLESVFGKYKLYSERCPMKEVGKAILTIPAFIADKSADLVTKAMESVRSIDVDKWASRVLGQSMFSKRKEAFKDFKRDTKIV